MKFFKAAWPLVVFPALKLLIHLATLDGYGIFRDELYYVACAERPALGYVDHPPLSIAVLWAVRSVFGEGLVPMRVTAAVVGAVTVLLVGLLARRMGGGIAAQVAAMVAYLAAPFFWFGGHVYSMNVFDGLFWALAALAVLRAVRSEEGEIGPWAVLGGILGLGLLNKISVLWLGAGLGVGLIAGRERRYLRTPGPYLAAALSALIFLPHVIWQIAHGLPTLEFIKNATGHKMVAVSPLDFFAGQLMLVGGIPGALFAVLGLGLLLLDREGRRRYGILGWIFLTVCLILVVNGTSRSGYLAPAYAWIFAAGGRAVERLVGRFGTRQRSVLWMVILGTFAVRGTVALPFTLPVLPVEDYLAHARRMGVEPSTAERKELGALPQHYADMFGWREKVIAAREAFSRLDPEERDRACLFARNYGVAGALGAGALVLGGEAPSPPLPPVISGHNNFWLWGPGSCTGEVLIVLGGSAEDLAGTFESVERVGTVECAPCMPYEDHQGVFVARGPKISIEQAWTRLKHYD